MGNAALIAPPDMVTADASQGPGRQPADGKRPTLVGKHLPALDGLRGMAILPVLIYHFADPFHSQALCDMDRNVLLVRQAGWVGVDLFFVLSGFLITGILLDTRDNANFFTAFYGRRVLRIFPAYYATLAVFFVLLPSVFGALPHSLQSAVDTMGDHQVWFWCYLANWLFALQGDFNAIPGGYFWSLAVEEQFYLVWPLFVFWLRPDRLVRVIWWLLPGTFLLRVALLLQGASTSTVYVATFTHMDGLLAGALLAGMLRQRPFLDPSFGILKVVAFASCLTLVTLGLWQGHFRFWDFWIAAGGYSLLAICFAFLLIAAVSSHHVSPGNRLFRNPILRSFGQYSYVIYLLHVPIALILEKGLMSPADYPVWGSILPAVVLFMLIAMAVCWVTGFLSWHLFEKHFLKLKRLFSYGSPPLNQPTHVVITK